MSSSGSDKVLEVPKDNEKDDQRPLDSREQPPHAETDKPPASSSLPETTQANSPPSVKDATLTTSNPPSGSPASPPDTEKKVTMDGGDTKDDTTNGAVDDEKKQAATALDTKDSETKPVASNGSALAKDGNGDTKHDKSPSTATATSTLPKDEKTSLEKPAKKKKRKSRNLWRFLNSCFTSSVLEESGTERAKPFSKSSKSKKSAASPTAASKEDEKTKNKNAGLPAEAAPSISSSMGPAHTLNTKPATPSRRSSAIVNGDGDVVIPPAHAPDLLPKAETAGVTSGAVQAPGSTGSEEDSEGSVTDEERHRHLEEEDDEERLILNGGNGIPIGPDGKEAPLLPPMAPSHKGRKCLVLDLDETLVHSSFKLIPQADYVVPVEIEWQWHNVYVIKRPGVDAFLKRMGELYEVVVFTASLSKYADPVLDKLDIHKVVSHRLFRESCYLHKGNYVKDLSQLGRPIGDTIILDNSPASYIFHPNNAVPVSSWFNDPHDTELTDMSPFLADLAEVADIRGVLDGGI